MNQMPHRPLSDFQAGHRDRPKAPVQVSPSQPQIRRGQPSLSFQVAASGAWGFDVIVATDPSLFDPANAHRRTPKNFRSSRQDFQGEPIEIETGFYLLPRAFLRDLVTVEPRPTRLYYVAVAYTDEAAKDGSYSVNPADLAAAPHVTLAADLSAASLSKVLGVAVERLGAVNALGRVMAVRSDPARAVLPAAIGGLPVNRRIPDPAAPPPRHPAPQPSAPRAAPVGNGRREFAPAATSSAPSGTEWPARPSRVNVAQAAFVDDDYAFGGTTEPEPEPVAFRDLDTGPEGHGGFAYDDGFDDDTGGAVARRAHPQRAEPTRPFSNGAIPPLDPGPAPDVAPTSGPATPGAPRSAGDGEEDLLVQRLLAEGAGGRYDALSLDGGYRGRFGPNDAYYQRAHDGLRFGPHQAMQDNGELGELLSLMNSADPSGFSRIFGQAGDELLAVTNADGPSGLELSGGRSTRVQPVAGHDLWEDPWIDRFSVAAQHPPFQAAMRGQIIARRLDPIEPAAEALGLAGGRGRAMLLSLAIRHGRDGALAIARAAVNPFDTPARLGAALDAIGFADLGAFRIANGLGHGDSVDAPTHFALIHSLRRLGPDSPVQIPDAEAVMDALVLASGTGAGADMLLRLRLAPAFGDDAVGG